MTEKKLTGYPSIDKPWLKYYTKEALEQKLPPNTIFGHLYERNKEHLDDIALIYFARKITYGQLFEKIERCARSLTALGIKSGDIVTISMSPALRKSKHFFPPQGTEAGFFLLEDIGRRW